MKKTAKISGLIIIMACMVLGSAVFAEMPGPDPDAIWNYITKVSPYKEWSFWPDHQGMQPGRAPHGPLHKVYVNDRALNSTKPPVQYGSIAVKESYNNAQELVAITIMYKIDDYDPENGDWFWAKYTTDGKAGPFGKPAGCVGCHGTRANNDFILVHEFN
ncbi:MAG TPA: cytochrome P460 family protein [Desulfatiglandales bacterium]|nr:cytochrome P460 family protein [Desulfatiglandales bacterium]